MQRPFASLVLAAALASAAAGACAQDFAPGWNPRSGDAWVDAQLADINRYGLQYRDPFIDEMTRYYDAPRALVGDLLLRRHWAPGDIYFACALAQVAGRPCRDVVDAWERDHALGWGAIARHMGIAPGSAGFHRLKRAVVPSFDRWGRPIEIDASLAPDFPGRGDPRARGNAGQPRAAHGRHGNDGKHEDADSRVPDGDMPGHDNGHGHG